MSKPFAQGHTAEPRFEPRKSALKLYILYDTYLEGLFSQEKNTKPTFHKIYGKGGEGEGEVIV